MSAQIKTNTRDIEDLKVLVKEQNQSILDSLERINTTMLSIQADVTVLKAYRKIEIEAEKKWLP